MKKSILTSIFIIPLLVFATEYTSLIDGDWSNNVDVWSIDGVTACGCVPDISMGDTVNIDHNIIQDFNLIIEGGSLVNINDTGSLIGFGMTMEVSNGSVVANGDVTVKKLTIGINGSFDITLAQLYIETRVYCYGYLGLHYSNMIVHQGNVVISPSGVFDITGGSALHYDLGNFNNFGVTNICNTCCVQMDAGNIKNEIGGVLNGDGAIMSDNGNIQNSGNWDIDIDWCSAGSDFGMPSLESCIEAQGNCALLPLPVELISFNGVSKFGYNEVYWQTGSEFNCDYYSLQRSEEGIYWELVANVEGVGSTSEISNYQVDDFIQNTQTLYYRLVQVDINGNKQTSDLISLKGIIRGASIVYPNPSEGYFYLTINDFEEEVEVSIRNMLGTEVYYNAHVQESPFKVESLLESGMYILTIDKKHGDYENVKLMVR